MIDRLRDEIIESQRARADLMKWKLVLAAAIGAAALGIGSKEPRGVTPGILLALIPFVCLYVDAVCFHNEIRIMAIACYVRTRGAEPVWKRYEMYCKENRGVFALENIALVVTTALLAFSVLLIGLFKDLQTLVGVSNDFRAGSALVWSGFIGVVAGVGFFLIYWRSADKFDRRAEVPESPSGSPS